MPSPLSTVVTAAAAALEAGAKKRRRTTRGAAATSAASDDDDNNTGCGCVDHPEILERWRCRTRRLQAGLSRVRTYFEAHP